MADSSFLIMNLMRILTPEEINELTTKYCGEKRVSLTSLMSNKVDVQAPNPEVEETAGLAKIIPFSKTSKAEPQKESQEIAYELAAGQNVQKLFRKLYGVNSNSAAYLIQSEEEDIVVEIGHKKSASIFILEEKEKLETSQRKLKSTEIIRTYKKVSGVDLEIERGHQDDLSWSPSHGLLVNKKQA